MRGEDFFVLFSDDSHTLKKKRKNGKKIRRFQSDVLYFAETGFLKMHLKPSEELFHLEAVNDNVIYDL